MPGTIGQGVTLQGIYDTKYNHVFNVSGTVVKADEGKAVSQDIAAASTVKLCAAGERIVGLLTVYENRLTEGSKIGTVSRKGYFVLPYTGANPTLGQGVIGGATAGSVAGSGALAAANEPVIWAVDTTAKTVLVSIGL